MHNKLGHYPLILFIVLACHHVVFSKDWRGITPLHSTVKDVERKLGPYDLMTGLSLEIRIALGHSQYRER